MSGWGGECEEGWEGGWRRPQEGRKGTEEGGGETKCVVE